LIGTGLLLFRSVLRSPPIGIWIHELELRPFPINFRLWNHPTLTDSDMTDLANRDHPFQLGNRNPAQ
jgi:hypothetical protein